MILKMKAKGAGNYYLKILTLRDKNDSSNFHKSSVLLERKVQGSHCDGSIYKTKCKIHFLE